MCAGADVSDLRGLSIEHGRVAHEVDGFAAEGDEDVPADSARGRLLLFE